LPRPPDERERDAVLQCRHFQLRPRAVEVRRHRLRNGGIKYLNYTSVGASPFSLTNVNGMLFFLANDRRHGNQVWQRHGHPSGTALGNDIRPGSADSTPSNLTNLSGTLFFAASDGSHGFELWRSNGTSAGTTLVNDIRPGANGSYPRGLTNVSGT